MFDFLLEENLDLLKLKHFRDGFKQVHHIGTTVSDHSIAVAKYATNLYYFLIKIGVKIDLSSIQKIALLHDLGIIGREDGRFKKRGLKGCCLLQHPKDSVKIVDALNLNEKVKNGIESHMWPFSFSIPKSKEAWIVNFSDKFVGTKEGILSLFNLLFKKRKSLSLPIED